MISANQLPSFTYSQLIHANRLDTIMYMINDTNNQGLKYQRLSYALTKAEVSYLKLYGYRVLTWGREGSDIFWH